MKKFHLMSILLLLLLASMGRRAAAFPSPLPLASEQPSWPTVDFHRLIEEELAAGKKSGHGSKPVVDVVDETENPRGISSSRGKNLLSELNDAGIDIQAVRHFRFYKHFQIAVFHLPVRPADSLLHDFLKTALKIWEFTIGGPWHIADIQTEGQHFVLALLEKEKSDWEE